EQAPEIDRRPSEYFLSGRCFIGCDPDEKGVAHVVESLGEGVVVYASDYCHWDCKFPDTVKILAGRADLSERAKQAIFDDNPRRPDGGGAVANCLLLAAARKGTPLLPGSSEQAVVAPLAPVDGDYVVTRFHGVTPFHGTELDALLRNLGVRTVVASGVSVNVG